MKEELKIYRDNFLSKNFYIEKDITDEEFAALSDNEKKGWTQSPEGPSNKYFKKETIELNDEDFKLFLNIRNLETNIEMNKKLRTIKNILIFWLILTIIPLVLYIILYVSS